jgi:hypothetical protein
MPYAIAFWPLTDPQAIPTLKPSLHAAPDTIVTHTRTCAAKEPSAR